MNVCDGKAVNQAVVPDRRGGNPGRRLSDMLRGLSVVANIGCRRAGRGLSEMTGAAIEAQAAKVRRLPLASVPDLVGGPEAVIATTYLKISGDVQGHMLLMLPLEDARCFASMLLGERIGDGLDLPDLARSALAEAGNITGSFFLAALADATSMAITPSPPTVVVDMSGAVLDTVLAEIAQESDDVFVIDTIFAQRKELVNAIFLVLPHQRHIDMILDRLPR